MSIAFPSSYFQLDAGLSPRVLGRHEQTPASLSFSAGVKELSQSPPPGITALTLEMDRHLSLNAEELPTCGHGLHVRVICPRAQIGEGTATILAPDESPEPVTIEADLDLYNGGVRGGVAEIYVVLRVPSPRDRVILGSCACGQSQAACSERT